PHYELGFESATESRGGDLLPPLPPPSAGCVAGPCSPPLPPLHKGGKANAYAGISPPLVKGGFRGVVLACTPALAVFFQEAGARGTDTRSTSGISSIPLQDRPGIRARRHLGIAGQPAGG